MPNKKNKYILLRDRDKRRRYLENNKIEVSPSALSESFKNDVTYKIDSQKPFTGCCVLYHNNGQLWSTENYKDGKLDGLWEEFHENGQLK